MEEHLRNVVVSVLALVIFAAIDYRFWKRFAFWLLLVTIILLVAVLAFGEVIFGAKRSFTMAGCSPASWRSLRLYCIWRPGWDPRTLK